MLIKGNCADVSEAALLGGREGRWGGREGGREGREGREGGRE